MERPKRGEDGDNSAVDAVFANAESAKSEALTNLDPDESDPAARATSLWTLGKLAFEDNRVDDAADLLRNALDEAPTASDLFGQIQMSMALVYSNRGDSEGALRLLDEAADKVEPEQLHRLHQQQSIILADLGRLEEALDAQQLTLLSARSVQARPSEARALANMGALASMLGRLDEAMEWYVEARSILASLDMPIITAGIGGNIGYVESRRGHFTAALRWYQQALDELSSLADAGRTRASTMFDMAQTQLDAGLYADAFASALDVMVEAVDGNELLAARARLVGAQALLAMGRQTEALGLVKTAESHFRQSGNDVFVAWCRLLAVQCDGEHDPSELEMVVEQITRAGWQGEAQRVRTLLAHKAWQAGDLETARRLLEPLRSQTEKESTQEQVDRVFGLALLSLAEDDADEFRRLIDRGHQMLEKLRMQLGVEESGTIVDDRAKLFRELAFSFIEGVDDPQIVLRESDRWRATWGPSVGLNVQGLVEQHRNTRVALSEAQFEGRNVNVERRRLERLEREIGSHSAERQTAASGLDVPQIQAQLLGAEMIEFLPAADQWWRLHTSATGCDLRSLGALPDLDGLVNEQRMLLRQIAAGNLTDPTKMKERLNEVATSLQRDLLPGVALAADARVTIVPSRSLFSLAWSLLPNLAARSLSIAPSASGWLRSAGGVPVPADITVGVMAGPHLLHAEDEAASVAKIHGASVSLNGDGAGVQATTAMLHRVDLAHLATHGSFRSDNPFLSSLLCADRPLTLADLHTVGGRLASTIVLSACEAGASADTRDLNASGAALALLQLGARRVIAPIVHVSDAHTPLFANAFHHAIAAGEQPDDALATARQHAESEGSLTSAAVAAAFQLFGRGS